MKIPELTTILPLNKDQKIQVENLIRNFDYMQLTWLAGYLTGITLPQSLKTQLLSYTGNISTSPAETHTIQDEITILYGSRTGNGLSLAKKFKEIGSSMGIEVSLKDMNEYPLHQLKDEKTVLVIVSTHGEGIPPIAAEEFYQFIHGKRAPKLTDTKFSV